MSLTRVFTIEPNPHWVIIDNFSRLPNGAAIYTYRSRNPVEFKPAYMDPGGLVAFEQPIVGHDNGTMPPIYWEFNPNLPDETYYIRVYDKRNDPGSDAQFLWDFNGLSGSSGGSGGGTIINATAIQNLVYNNVFFRNIGNTAGTPSLPLSLTIAPGSHQGFVNDPTNSNVTLNGPVGPDIVFAKNNSTASDSIEFVDFTPLGTRYIPGTDITPKTFMKYICLSPGSGETYKYVQFPISQGVQNLSGEAVTLKFFGICNSGNTNVIVKLRQFFGSGGGTADKVENFPTITLTNAWKSFILQGNVPDATGSTLGTCGNDGLFLQVCFPFNAETNISFTKPELFLGTVPPDIQYENNDKIDSVINTPRTGDIRTSVNLFAPYGWVRMNDGTIANGFALTPPLGYTFSRNNVDTFPLYVLMWNTFVGNQPLAQMFSPDGLTPISYTDPITDFVAGNQIALTKAAGRVMAGVSTPHLIGTFEGVEDHTITLTEIPQHTHDSPIPGRNYILESPGPGPAQGGIQGSRSLITGGITTWGPGPQAALHMMQPTVYMNVFIKL